MNLTPLQERALVEAYTQIYALAGAKKEDHFIFTSSGAEGVNHAIFSAYLEIARRTGKNHFLCLQTDEAPTIMSMSRLRELGCVFQTIPVDKKGKVSKQAVAEMISPRTAMLSLNHANGLTGILQPVEEISEVCKERGIFFHIEITHTLGKSIFTFEGLGADVLSFEGSRPGTGGMFIKNGVEISPFILGGNEQGHLRGGSWNVEGLLNLARDAQQSLRFLDHHCMEMARLRTLFEEMILKEIPTASVLFQNQERVPHISCMIFPGVVSEALAFRLHQKNHIASFGGNQFQHLHHLLKACGIEEPHCHSGLSFNFAPETTEEEIEELIDCVIKEVKLLQNISQKLLEDVA